MVRLIAARTHHYARVCAIAPSNVESVLRDIGRMQSLISASFLFARISGNVTGTDLRRIVTRIGEGRGPLKLVIIRCAGRMSIVGLVASATATCACL